MTEAYNLGIKTANRYWANDPSYGEYLLTGIRAQERLARTSREQHEIRRGFDARLREIASLPFGEIEKIMGRNN